MNQATLRATVRSILEDPSAFRFSDDIVDRYTTDALRRVTRSVGKAQGRLALSLVQGQQSYDLPDGIRKLTSVKVLPENGSEPLTDMLEVDLAQIPVTAPYEADPTYFSLDVNGGANGQTLSLFVYPPPARSTADSLIVTYEKDFTTSTEIAFLSEYELIIARLTAAGCLTEMEDQVSIQKAEYLRSLAERDLSDLALVSTIGSYGNTYRAFP